MNNSPAEMVPHRAAPAVAAASARGLARRLVRRLSARLVLLLVQGCCVLALPPALPPAPPASPPRSSRPPRGHHQPRRDWPSTRVASGDARGRPTRSRHAAIAGLTAPLVGPAGIAMAGPPRLGRHGRAAKAGPPVPDRHHWAASAGQLRTPRPTPAPSRSVLDQNS